MAIREGRWDCPSCGSRRVYGRHVDCPGCGKPRPAGIRFYLTDDAPVITDAARLREARAGADWVCEHCGASTRATETDCDGCGAPRGSSPAQPVIDYALADVPRSGDVPRPAPRASTASAESAPRALAGDGKKEPGKPASAWETCLGCGCLGLIAVILLSLATTCGGNGPVGGEDLLSAQVTGKRWERSFVVEERRVIEGTGWDLPDSAQVVSSRRRLRGAGRVVDRYERVTRRVQRSRQVPAGTRTATRDVPDTRTRTREVSERVQTGERTYVCGQRDMGNGYFEDIECSEPVYENQTRTEEYVESTTRTEEYEETVYRTEYYWENETTREPVYRRVQVYDTFYTYRVPAWDSVEVRTAAGETTLPSWPDTVIGPTQRIRDRSEAYWITFRRAGGAPYGTRVPLEVWRQWSVGRRVGLRMAGDSTARTQIFPADSLAACRRWHLGRDKDDPPADSLGCTRIAEKMPE